MPPLLCGLIYYLTEENLKKAMMIEAVMPTAMMVITLAKIYGGKAEVISLIVFCSQVLSLITIPIWLSLFIG
jgi:predicted permease